MILRSSSVEMKVYDKLTRHVFFETESQINLVNISLYVAS